MYGSLREETVLVLSRQQLVLTHLFSPVLTCLTPSGVQVGAFPQHSSENRILVLTGGKSPIADMVPVRLFVFLYITFGKKVVLTCSHRHTGPTL